MNSSDYVNTTPLEQMVQEIGVDKVFGEPVEEGDVTLIPVAQVAFGFGYGGGGGDNVSINGGNGSGAEDAEDLATSDQPDELDATGEAGGGGAGAGGHATPRGFIRIANGKATFDPIGDDRWVPISGIFMVAWVAFWFLATVRVIAKQIGQTKRAGG